MKRTKVNFLSTVSTRSKVGHRKIVILVLGLIFSVAGVCHANNSIPTISNVGINDPMPDSFKKELEVFANLNSGTNNPQGNQKIRELYIDLFSKLGFSSKVIEVKKIGVQPEDPVQTHHVLVFEIPDSKPDILVLGHTDTVFEKFHPFQKLIDNGDTINGPGVTDMKGGLLLLFHSLQALKDQKKLSRFRIAINDDEEVGSKSTGLTLKEFADQSKYVLILESPQMADVSTSHSGIIQKEITIYGVESHAGAAPLKGVSACLENALKTVQVYKLNKYDRGLTFNSGVVRTYDAAKPNTLCGELKTIWDIRYIKPSDFDKGLKKFSIIMNHNFAPNPSNKKIKDTKIIDLNFTPALPPEKSKRLVELFRSGAKKELNLDIVAKHKGGVDAYGISASNVEVITGLGLTGNEMHSDREFTDVKAFGRKFNLLVTFLNNISVL